MEGAKTCNVSGISFNKDEIVTAMKVVFGEWEENTVI